MAGILKVPASAPPRASFALAPHPPPAGGMAPERLAPAFERAFAMGDDPRRECAAAVGVPVPFVSGEGYYMVRLPLFQT